MNISKVNPSIFPLNISEISPIKAEEINAFSEGTTQSLSAIVKLLNETVVPVLGSLPSFFTPESKLDATNVYVDSSANATKDAGLFYYTDANAPSNSRPITIYEAFLAIVQLLANTENGLREGVKVGDITNKITLSASEAKKLAPWPYTDAAFSPMLFELSGSQIIPANVSVYYNTADGYIYIKNNVATSKQIYGYIWHPVLTI